MISKREAAACAGTTSGGSEREAGFSVPRLHSSTPGVEAPVALSIRKRGRCCIIGKLVVARPLGALVLAVPYRHRQAVAHVSLPPAALALARQQGAQWWIVRNDGAGTCYRLPLSAVEAKGWLSPSEGRPEWFVPLTAFERTDWQSWPYVEATVDLDAHEWASVGGEQARAVNQGRLF